MSFVPNFTATQTLGSPTVLNLQDTSSGSDGAIVGKRVYLQKSDGSYLVPTGTTTSYVVWGIGASTIAITVLNQDYSLNVLVQWLDAGNNVLYSKSNLFDFTLNSEAFLYSLTLNQSSNPSIVNDQNYYFNKMKLRVEVDSSASAITIGNDIASGQECLDRAAYMIANESLYF